MYKRALTELGNVRGLITVPGTIALFVWAIAPMALWLDEWFAALSGAEPYRFLQTDYQTAIAILSTIAGAAVTTLSLVYSLVLVVFTLAAGTIAPRLLRRFTSDRVNQVTAGLFGGLFLFALTLLHQTDPGFVPVLSIGMAVALSAVAVLQLIFFVHTVSRSVTIDEEIAEISRQLESRLARVLAETEEDDRAFEFDEASMSEICTEEKGYIIGIDEQSLLNIAAEHGLFIDITRKTGTFMLEGQTIARFSPGQGPGDGRATADAVNKAIELKPARGSVEDIEYSISVLLEIALRALSPGVNDTFTAIACVDRISSACAEPVRRGLRRRVLADDAGTVRVQIAGLTVEDVINTAFHPLRRAASGNLLMLQHIADALVRLHDVADAGVAPILERHAQLLIHSYEQADPLPVDRAFLASRLDPILS